ncbi:MAG: hypothetical protein ACI4M6_02060 [Christensenellaceae bacterium]
MRRKIIFILCTLIVATIAFMTIYFSLSLSGVIQSNKIKLVIEAKSETKVYDGTPLVGSEYRISYGEIRQDHKIEVVFVGEQTEVGESELTTIVYITDFNGADALRYYDVEQIDAKLTVKKKDITITTASDEKFFDGEPLKNEGYSVAEGGLIEGHEISCQSVTEITDVGSVDNVLLPKITDENEQDITDNYDITFVYGKLTVVPRVIKLTTGSKDRVYNGTALTNDVYELTEGNIIEGHSLYVEVTGQRTEVGTSKNTADLKVFDAEGKDATSFYDIQVIEGDLTVYKIDLNVFSDSLEQTYNGQPVSCPTYLQPEELMPGDVFYGELNVSVINAGVADNTFANAYVLNGEGQNVTSNYNFIFHDGTITVNKLNIIVETKSANKVYDGSPLTYNSEDHTDAYYVTGWMPSGETAQVEVYGTITAVGEVDNSAVVMIKKTIDGETTDVSGNYNVTYRFGKLTVLATKDVIYFRTVSQTKVYDGELFQTSPESITVVDASSLKENHQIVDGSMKTISALHVGTYENRVDFKVENTLTGGDVSNSYQCGFQSSADRGWLTITARELTLTADQEYVEYVTVLGGELTLTWTIEGLCANDVIDSSSVRFVDGALEGAISGVKITGGKIIVSFDTASLGSYMGEICIDVDSLKITNTKYGNEEVTENYQISSDPMTLAVI